MSMIAHGEPRRHGSVWPWLSVVPFLGLFPVLWAASVVKRSFWPFAGLACLAGWIAVFATIDALPAVSEPLLLSAWLGQIVAAVGLHGRLRAETRGVSDEELPGLQQTRAADALVALQRRARIVERPGGGGTLLTEPVVFLEGSHRSDYRFFRRDAMLVATFSASERTSCEVRDCDGRCLLVLRAGSRCSDDVLLDADGAELARLRRMTKADDGRPGRRLRGPGTRDILVRDHMIGRVLRRDPRRTLGGRSIVDRSGLEVAHIVRTAGGAGPGGMNRRFVIDVREHADERRRAVALVAPVVWDWSIVSWDAGG
jgi:hypothetical protein